MLSPKRARREQAGDPETGTSDGTLALPFGPDQETGASGDGFFGSENAGLAGMVPFGKNRGGACHYWSAQGRLHKNSRIV